MSDLVIRHMTVRTDEDLRRAAKLKAKRKVQTPRSPESGIERDLDLEDEAE